MTRTNLEEWNNTVNKADIDREIARLMGKPKPMVASITQAFIRQIRNQLVEGHRVFLSGLGEFSVKVIEGKSQLVMMNLKTAGPKRPRFIARNRMYRVSFKKTKLFGDLLKACHGAPDLKEDEMDKYGVDESGSEKEKLAAKGCPKCGGKVEKHGDVLACQHCGTEPFEKKG